MPVSAAASDVQKNFGSYHDRALAGEAVRVTKYGRETVYILSAKAFHELKQSQRHALAAADLSAAEMDLISKADVPAEQRYTLDDLT
jgi:prevent-host-death family protein